MSQLLYPLALGSGRPRTAVRLSAATLLLSGAGMLIVGLCFPARAGTIAVSAVWVAVYALLLIWGVRYLRRQWAIRGGDLARTLLLPFAGTGVLVLVVEVSRLVIGDVNSWLQVEIVVAALGLTYAGLFLPAWRGRVAA